MSEAKHTPGPWGYGLTKGGMLLASIAKKGIGDIALIYRSSASGSCRGIEEDEAHANARLISAAPELLEEMSDQIAWLKHYLSQLVHVSTRDDHGQIVNGFAAAQIPDWAIKQKLESLEAAIRKAQPEKKESVSAPR